MIESYFNDGYLQKLVRHQLESYNDFVDHQIQKTIDMFNPVQICSEQDYDKLRKKYKLEVMVTFDKFYLYRPQIHENNGAAKLMFPQEARLHRKPPNKYSIYPSMVKVPMKFKPMPYLTHSGMGFINSK